jgi:iron complex transport system permease protein
MRELEIATAPRLTRDDRPAPRRWQLPALRVDGKLHPAVVLVILGALLIAACLVSLNLGFIRIGPLDVIRTLAGAGTDRDELVLFDLRLPRIVIAILIGVGLATAGAILQGITQNVLADPGLLGISAGAGLAVFVLLALTGYGTAERDLNIPAFTLPMVALIGGTLAAMLIYVLAYKHGVVTPSRLLLVGVAVSFGASACIPILGLRISSRLYDYAVAWLEGSLAGTSWEYVTAVLPWIVVLTAVTFYKSQTLNVLTLGDQMAAGLGLAVERQRLILIGAAVGLTASSVAVGGGIAFVGLVGPHLARRLVGPNYRLLLPAAALAGGLLLVVADAVARNLLAPFEIPVGIVVAILGAPYFLFLLMRTKG